MVVELSRVEVRESKTRHGDRRGMSRFRALMTAVEARANPLSMNRRLRSKWPYLNLITLVAALLIGEPALRCLTNHAAKGLTQAYVAHRKAPLCEYVPVFAPSFC